MQSDPALRAAFEAAKTAWPGIEIKVERFVRYLRDAQVLAGDLASRSADLYLACGCADGDSSALNHFESEVLSRIGTFVARFNLAPHALDEVRQIVRVKLLVGTSPGIARYRGRGPLGAWVRVTAVRVALDVVGARNGSFASGDIDLLDFGVGLGDSPELATARNLYRDRLCAALEEGLQSLVARDRTLLRLYVVDDLNIEDIGTIYRVHRATVARWLVGIRARVLKHARERLGLRRDASSSEMRSLIAILRDEIHISAKRVLTEVRGP